MKEELQNKAVEILTSIQTTVSGAKDFTLAQLPDIANQYITYGIVSNVTYSVGALIIATVCCWIACWCLRGMRIRDSETLFGGMMASTIVGLFFLYNFIVGLEETIMVIFAPKVWLILELSKLIK
jgi:hypothetical protein